ncbi:Lectin-related protein [Spatholobus suberectus]|nr:Lectin-related protein [Spatholobus suberectus]
MAPTNWRQWHIYSVLLILVMYLFSLQVKAQNQPTLSFTMDRFVVNQQDLIFQGDARVSSTGVLEVTKKENGMPVRGSTGRTLYSAPFQIWDSTTNRATNFVTEFTFIIKAATNQTADGIAFFLAPPESEIPPGSGGGLLGLFSDRFYDSSRRTVAVEFDTCFNVNWDPPGLHHIGINVNSIQSVATEPWQMKSGEKVTAMIYYSDAANFLGLQVFDSSGHQTHGFGRFIDLKGVLPEWVRFGFSATVGLSPDHLESHDVLSWSFVAFRTGGTDDDKTLRDAMMQFLPQHRAMPWPFPNSPTSNSL